MHPEAAMAELSFSILKVEFSDRQKPATFDETTQLIGKYADLFSKGSIQTRNESGTA